MKNPIVRKYAIDRVDNLVRRKREEMREKHTKKTKDPSDKEMVRVIRDGDCNLKSRIPNRDLLDMTIREAFDFSWLSEGRNVDEAAVRKEMEKVSLQAHEVKDAIMLLTDEQKAIDMLTEFCKGE